MGKPPQEDYYLGKATERIFLPLLRLQLPEIRDISMPAEGVFHNLMLVSIRKQYPGHARKIMNAIWGMGQAMFTKCIVVVDEDVDVQNYSEVAWKALNNIDPERDIQFVMGPVDSLDHYAGWTDSMELDLAEDDDKAATIERVEQVLQGLPEEFRIPLAMKDIDGLSVEEVARILGKKDGAVLLAHRDLSRSSLPPRRAR